jgi:hypothetical protein
VRQPARVLAAWIDEQLHDIHANQVPRLAQLRGRLQSDAFQWNNALLASAVAAMRDRADGLDLDPLRPRGLFAVWRRPAPGGSDVSARCAQVISAAHGLHSHANEFAAHQASRLQGARRMLLELELEQQSLTSDMAQAVDWLEDMSHQMRREGADLTEAARLAALAQRAESFTPTLKGLHALQETAAAVCSLGRNVLERRANLIEHLRASLDGFQQGWLRSIGPVAGPAASASSTAALDAAVQAHGELVAHLEETHACCEALRIEEHALGLRLAAMGVKLEALLH